MSWRLPALSALAALVVAAIVPGSALPTEAAPAAAPQTARQPADPPGAPGAKADWTEADKTGFGTARDPREQRVVHAAAGAGERGLLPRPLHPQRAQPGARRDRRGLHRPGVDRHAAPHRAARRAQPALPPGQHRQGRPLPARRDVRDRPAPRRAWRCASGWSRSTAGATGSTRCTTRRSPTTAWTTAAARAATRSWPATTRPRRALVSRAARSARRRPATSAPATAGPTCATTRRSTTSYAAGRPGQRRAGRSDPRRHRPRRPPATPSSRLGFGADAPRTATATATASRAAAFDDPQSRYDYGWHAWLELAERRARQRRTACAGSTSPPRWPWPPPRTSRTRAPSSPRPTAPVGLG